MILQSLRSLELVSTVLAFVLFLVRMHYHVHCQSPLCVELQSTVGTNVQGVCVDVLVDFKAGQILELLRTVGTLKWSIVRVNQLVLLQTALCPKRLSALFANKRSQSNVDGSNVRVDVYRFGEFLLAVRTWIAQPDVLGKVDFLMQEETLFGGKLLRALVTVKRLLTVAVLQSHVLAQVGFLVVDFITLGAPAREPFGRI